MGAVAVFPTFQMPPVIRWLKALVNLARDVAADAIIGAIIAFGLGLMLGALVPY
jgi:hypothetical protein